MRTSRRFAPMVDTLQYRIAPGDLASVLPLPILEPVNDSGSNWGPSDDEQAIMPILTEIPLDPLLTPTDSPDMGDPGTSGS